MSQIPCRLSIISRRSFCSPNIKLTKRSAHKRPRKWQAIETYDFSQNNEWVQKMRSALWEKTIEWRRMNGNRKWSINSTSSAANKTWHTHSESTLNTLSMPNRIFSREIDFLANYVVDRSDFLICPPLHIIHTLIVRSFLIRHELSSSFCATICVRRLCDGRRCGLGSHHGHLNFIISMKTKKKSSSSNIRFFFVFSPPLPLHLFSSMKFKCHRLKINKIFFPPHRFWIFARLQYEARCV